ncbi:MAG: hypothetical protein L3K05_02380, partial [Thermoplasmata archaeon]|nr:hypothetical protein [Thermoplasmata archaeon]
PLTRLEVTAFGRSSTVFVQEAETVRLSTSTGAHPVTGLVEGDLLRVLALPPARHLGRVVEETVEER